MYKKNKIYKMKQQTEEWFDIKSGKMSSSHSSAIASNGAGLKTYIQDILMNEYCLERDSFESFDMRRGNELEPFARRMYAVEKVVKVGELGWIQSHDMFGCSPDGVVGKDGLIEIKSMNDKNHFDFVLNGKIKSDWVWQMQGAMLVSKRKWCDFVAYNENFENKIEIKRVYADKKAQEKIMEGIKSGIEIYRQLKEKLYENVAWRKNIICVKKSSISKMDVDKHIFTSLKDSFFL